jgi:hypothetical protein
MPKISAAYFSAFVVGTPAVWHGTQTTADAFVSAALPQSREVTMHSKLLAIVSAGVFIMAGSAAGAQSGIAGGCLKIALSSSSIIAAH